MRVWITSKDLENGKRRTRGAREMKTWSIRAETILFVGKNIRCSAEDMKKKTGTATINTF